MKRHSFAVMVSVLIVTIIIATSFTQFNANNDQQSLKDKQMRNDTSDKKNLVVTRVFDAPVEQVWKAWIDSEQVMRWWGPKGFTSPLAKMDFRVGGVSLVCMRAPKEFGGQDMYNTWTYQKIEPFQRIEYILNFADKDGNKLDPAKMGLPPGIPYDVPHVVIFKALSNTKTQMTVKEYGYATDQTVEISRSGLEECLDKMAEIFKK